MFGLIKKDKKIDLFLTNLDIENLKDNTLEGKLRNENDTSEVISIHLSLTKEIEKKDNGCSIKYDSGVYEIKLHEQTYNMFLNMLYVQKNELNLAYVKTLETKAPHMKKSLDFLKQISK